MAQRGIHILVPEVFLAEARAILAEEEATPQLSESRSFARHYLANALIFLCTFTSFGLVYFPYWVRAQRDDETSETALN